jgi:hypothetical protein
MIGMDISAIIVGALALIGTIIGNLIGNNKTAALVSYRLEQLEKKVNLHNNAVERLYKAEQAIEVQKEQIKGANHRLEDLEHMARAGE